MDPGNYWSFVIMKRIRMECCMCFIFIAFIRYRTLGCCRGGLWSALVEALGYLHYIGTFAEKRVCGFVY